MPEEIPIITGPKREGMQSLLAGMMMQWCEKYELLEPAVIGVILTSNGDRFVVRNLPTDRDAAQILRLVADQIDPPSDG